MRRLLQVGIVFLQRIVVLVILVEVSGLDQHPRIRSRLSCDGKHTDHGRGYKDVGVVQRHRNLIQASVFVVTDEHDVVTLFQLQSVILAQKLTAVAA